MSLMLALLLAGAAAEPSECRAALATEWPELVERLKDPVALILIPISEGAEKSDEPGIDIPKTVTKAIADAERLRALCVGDAEAGAILRSYEASQRLRTEDFAGAYRLLTAQPIDAAAPTASMDANNLLLAAGGIGEAEYRQATATVRAAHRAAAATLPLSDTGSARTDLGWIDGYRIGGRSPEHVFIAWPDAGMPMLLRVPQSKEDDQGARLKGCSVETSPSSEAKVGLSDTDALAYAKETFQSARNPRAEDEGFLGGAWEGISSSCTSLDDLLFAFGAPTRFIGDEFAAPSELSGKQIERMLGGSFKQQARATDAVIAQPEKVDPSHHIQIIATLWQRGDRLQATFLYYVWQVRFMPWAKLGSPSGEGALFGAIRATLGPVVNGWIGSDPVLNRQVLDRALTYERKLPLHPNRPEGVDEKTWLRTIEEVRESAAKQWLGQMPVTPEALKAWAKTRAKNGLPNGPVTHPGKPLPDHWQ